MSRPSFAKAWAASMQIYDPVNPAVKVATVVGGRVETNIKNPDPKQQWTNTCAVRISYILNYSGLPVPKIQGQTVSGGDKKQYFYRVKDVITFLKMRWGPPEVVKYPPSGGGALKGRKGLILFEVSGFSDALGHATLFNGSICYDSCYFNEPGANYKTSRANFWSLQ